MKNKIFYIILFIILLLSLLITGLLFDSNKELMRDIESKEILINDIASRDSILIEKTKEYSEIISKYTFENEFVLGNKKISVKELVDLFNNMLDENIQIKDSLNYFKSQTRAEKERTTFYKKNYIKYLDSMTYYKFGYKSAIKDYGIQYKIKQIDSSIILQRSFSKVDSALLLYPFYKDRIRKDTITGNWIITYEERQIINKKKKK